MHRYYLIVGLTVLACFFGAVGIANASKQGKWTVCEIVIDGWQLQLHDGQPELVNPTYDPHRQVRGVRTDWYASAPMIRTKNDLYLAGDPQGKEPTVRLTKEHGKDAYAEWAFEFIEKLPAPKPIGHGDYPNMIAGYDGYRFRMYLTDGPYKGWYVAVDELTKQEKEEPNNTPDWRPLKLVKDPKAAAVLEYRTKEYGPN